MDSESNQRWIFFWAAPDPEYDDLLIQEKEFKHRMMVRRALLSNLIVEGQAYNLPEAS
jgi:hypothetical protein